MTSDRDRVRLAETFDRAAAIYDRARPHYPSELFEALVELTGLVPRDNLLEIGCATGKATAPLAREGFRITCLEPGVNLAAVARRNLSEFDIEVIEGQFETWMPRAGERFALVYAATSWKWIDPKARYARAWEVLRPGGHLAFWNAAHVFPERGDTFFREIQEVYEEIGEDLRPGSGWPKPGELEDQSDEVDASGLFEMMHIRHYDWERVYSVEGYIELLDTFSGHIAMNAWQRERLYGEIRRRLASRKDEPLRRHWGTVLHIARRRD